MYLNCRDFSGTYEPTEDECDFSDPPSPNEEALTFIESATPSPMSSQAQPDNDAAATADDAAAASADATLSPACGVPHFWLTIFKYMPMFETMVKPADEPALKHLSDIQVHFKALPEMSFQLRFCFTPNAYFTDPVLTKEYLLKCEPDVDDPFMFDGPEIYSCRGCPIHWLDGMDLTQRVVRRKGPPADADGDQNAANMRKTDTFFSFFGPPVLPVSGDHREYEAINVSDSF